MIQYIVDEEFMKRVIEGSYNCAQKEISPYGAPNMRLVMAEVLDLTRKHPINVSSVEDLSLINRSCKFVPADEVIAIQTKDDKIVGYFIGL